MRKLMWFSIGFVAACALCAFLYSVWMLEAAIGFALAAVIFAFGARYKDWFRRVSVLFIGLAVGFSWFCVTDHICWRNARKVNDQIREVTLIVRDYSFRTNYGSGADCTVELDGKKYDVRVYLDEIESLEPGNRIIGKFRFRMDVSSSAQEIIEHNGRTDILRAYQEDHVIIERFWSTPLRDLPTVWRHQLLERIDDVFPEDTAGFAKALLLGDRTDIGYELNTAFKVSGISHVIAVSGLHVSILFGLVQLLSARKRVLTAFLGIPAIVLFAAVVGFTPSITRAAIMQIMMMLALLLNKEYDPPTALSFAALVMVAADPMVVTSVSFQLSFACMVGIQLMAQPLYNWMTEGRNWGRFRKLFSGVASCISVTLSATVMTTPLVALYFGTVSLVSILTNLMTLWVMSFIFYGIIAVCFIGAFSICFASFVAGIIAWPIRYILETAKFLSSLPLAAVYTKSGYIVAWLVFIYILLTAFLLLKKRHIAVFASAVVFSLCLCVGLSWAEPLMDDYRMTMLDVGQGQAIMLQAEGKTYLVDCGGDRDEEAADLVAETLLSQGIARLDGIILTHYDADHAGGVEFLLTRVDTDMILMPYAADDSGLAKRLKMKHGDRAIQLYKDLIITVGDLKLTIFAPESYNSGNESGLCVLFTVGKCDILITGDRSAAGERLLMNRHDLPQVDVLVAGHHGSKHSTSEQLLQAVRPSYALISVGEDNYYGHPAPETLERLKQYGCIIICTAENGTILYRG